MEKRFGLDCINYLTDVAALPQESCGSRIPMSTETKRLYLRQEIECRQTELALLTQRLRELEDGTHQSVPSRPRNRGWLAAFFRRFA